MARRPGTNREEDGPVKQRYNKLSVAREPYLAKARKCAELTIPDLIPPAKKAKPGEVATPHQAAGARCVNNLSNKLLMTLFPSNTPFFRLSISQFDLEKLLTAALMDIATERRMPAEEVEAMIAAESQRVNQDLERKLAATEQAAMREFELQGNRPTDAEAIKHLIVAGNVLRYSPPGKDGRPRIYSLPNYVVKRDPDGKVLEMITREGITAMSIAPEVRAACAVGGDEDNTDKEYDIYTHIRRAWDERGEYWEAVQELNGRVVPDSRGEYEIGQCPWLALRWTKADGEDYSRGHVGEYLGSLVSLEGLSEALLHGATGASRMLVFVNPNSGSGTKLKDVARAKNGAVLPGNATDVTFLKSDKYHDLRTPAERVQLLTQELYYAFLVTGAIQRDAERVTAQEIRLLAQELETALGGTYTVMAQEYQQPVIVSHIAMMQKDGSLPELPDDVKPLIITGMEALGRNTEYQRLMEYLQALKALPDQTEVGIRLDYRGAMNRLSACIGISMEGLFLPEEQVQKMKQAQAQQQQQMMMMQSLGPEAIKAGTQMMQQQQPQENA